jgi:hypothetical protein
MRPDFQGSDGPISEATDRAVKKGRHPVGDRPSRRTSSTQRRQLDSPRLISGQVVQCSGHELRGAVIEVLGYGFRITKDIVEGIVEGHLFPRKKGSPTFGRDYHSVSAATIATPDLEPSGQELDHVRGVVRHVVQQGVWIAEELSEHMTPGCGAYGSAGELDTLGVDVAEVLLQPVLIVDGQRPFLSLRQPAPLVDEVAFSPPFSSWPAPGKYRAGGG